MVYIYAPISAKEAIKMLTHEDICQAVKKVAPLYPLKKVSFFGSYADGTQTKDSDIDILVEFSTPTISLIKLSGLKLRLEEQLGLPVDLIHAPIPKDSYININKEVTVFEQA